MRAARAVELPVMRMTAQRRQRRAKDLPQNKHCLCLKAALVMVYCIHDSAAKGNATPDAPTEMAEPSPSPERKNAPALGRHRDTSHWTGRTQTRPPSN